ncbi:DUF6531 domain-containing protein [Streptomyces sp. MAR4 CNX-425]|uniref:DUF6531 domain-containing protein n=1 Tax=Streptomyces sp. MAR4 CNX-425 TaxID=3406343 RepID=UPI003B51451A
MQAEEPMTMKERRAQVADLRAPEEPGAVIELPDRTLKAPSQDSSPEKDGPPDNKPRLLAISPVTNMRVAPHSWFGFDVEWGDVKWDNPAGLESYHRALYRASDDSLIKQWCDSDPEGTRPWTPTNQWSVSDPTILELGVEYYMKVAVSADRGTNADPRGWGCATGWSEEVRSPNIAAQGPPLRITSGEKIGCVCGDTSGRQPFQGYLGDPVNTGTGALNESAVDVTLAAPGIPFELRRIYASDNDYAGMYGQGWTSAYDVRLQVAESSITYVSDSGSRLTFTKDASGAYRASSLGVTSRLSALSGGGFTLTTSAQEKLTFTSEGRLTAWQDSVGAGLSFSYSNGDLNSVSDAAGHTVQMNVDPATRLVTSIGLPGGRTISYSYTDGRLTSVKGAEGGAVTYGYDAAGRLSSITDAAGNKQMQTTYNSSGRVTEQTHADGTVAKFTRDTLQTNYQDANGGIWTDLYHGSVLSSRIDPLGNVTSYEYDDKLRLAKVRAPRGVQTKLNYDSSGNLLKRTTGSVTESWTYTSGNNVASHTDARGAKTTYTYDNSQRLIDENGPAGRTSYTYNTKGQVTSTTSPRGKTTTFAYDEQGYLTAQTSPSGAKQTFTYDAAGKMLTSTDPRGNVTDADPAQYTTTYLYKASDLLASVTDPAGNTTRYEYDANENRTKTTDATGQATTYEYDKFDRLTKITGPDGTSTSTNYDAVGNVTATINERGNKTTFRYDAANRLVATTSPRGNATGADPAKYTTTYGYDASGNQTKKVDATGALTTTKYDNFNRPTSVTDPLNGITKTNYDANGNVTQITDANGKVTKYSHTAANLLSSVTNPLGRITNYGYNADGDRTSLKTPLGNKTTWTYDDDGRVASEVDPRGNATGADPVKYTTTYRYDQAGNLTQVTDPLGGTQKSAFDRVGRQISTTNPNGKTTETSYDPLGRIKTVTAPDGGTTSYTYDTAGNVKTRTDANNHTTTYSYSDAHQLTSVTDPLNRTVTYGYDADGNRTTATNARGSTATTAYDALGRPTAVDYSDTTPDVRTTYDAVGNRTKVTDGTGTRTFTYSPVGRLKTASVPGLTAGFTYTYNDAGLRAKTNSPSGTATTYGYDADGNRTTSVTNNLTTSYTYDANGNLKDTTLPAANGYTENRTYNAAGRLTDIASSKNGTVLSGWHAVLDLAGQPTRIDNARTGKSAYYTYDDAGRLLTECTSTTQTTACPSGEPSASYTYDKVGNRTGHTTTAGATSTYSYDSADQLTQKTTGTNSTAYEYDADGNRTKAGSVTYAYDAENRLTKAVGDRTKEYTYDSDGNRREVGGSIRAWDINNPIPLLAGTYDPGANNLTREYRYNPSGQVEAMHNAFTDRSYYYHRDLIGSVTNVTSAADGTTLESYSYDAFGIGGPSLGTSDSSVNQWFGFAGEYKEFLGNESSPTSEDGGYNLRARTYDPLTGQFTGTDPLTAPQRVPGESSYAYAGNAPTFKVDPAGTCWLIPGSGDEGCWTADIPGTDLIPLSPVIEGIGNALRDTCEQGAEYARENGRWGWTGCVAEFTGINDIRRGINAYGEGDYLNGTAYCLGGVGQVGLWLMPAPKWTPAPLNPANQASRLATFFNVPVKSIVSPARVYRGDTRDPITVYVKGGFRPKGTNVDIREYATKNTPSAWVGTSRIAREAANFPQGARGTGTWVYEIRNPGQGISVNKALGGAIRSHFRGEFPSEREILFQGIDASKIVQAERWRWGMPTGEVIKNPWFKG